MSSAGVEGRMPPEVLRGDTCTLRALSVSDAALEQALSRDTEVVRWTYYPAEMTEQDARRRIQDSLARAREVRRYVILDRQDDPVGTCGVGRLDSDCPTIFYALLPRARGRGIATAAARLLVDWAAARGLTQVALETVEGNLASERVAAKAGFARVARERSEHRGRTVWLTRWRFVVTAQTGPEPG